MTHVKYCVKVNGELQISSSYMTPVSFIGNDSNTVTR